MLQLKAIRMRHDEMIKEAGGIDKMTVTQISGMKMDIERFTNSMKKEFESLYSENKRTIGKRHD
jgi:hypothetical protein